MILLTYTLIMSWYGPRTEEFKEKLREARKRFFANGGRSNRLGKPHTEEFKEKVRQASIRNKTHLFLVGKQKPHTEATKQKISEAKKGKVAWNGGMVTGRHSWNYLADRTL